MPLHGFCWIRHDGTLIRLEACILKREMSFLLFQLWPCKTVSKVGTLLRISFINILPKLGN